ncbi:hypothetical protein ISCGN_001678 [Ixodes scapularis]
MAMPPKRVTWAVPPVSDDTSAFIRVLQDYSDRVEEVVATEREAANQQFDRLLEENKRLAASMAAAAGQALAHNIPPGGVPPQSTPQFQPVAAFGGLRLEPRADTQSAVPIADPWAMGSQFEFQHSAATQTAATAPVEPRVLAPYAPAADPGRFFTGPDVVFNPYTLYNPQVAGRRVFTVSDPPARRDIAEAFIQLQQVSRHSQHIGHREIAELQLLECFVQLWDCQCIGLPARDKLRIFERVRLLYHVAQSGWGAALQGYADPSASVFLGPPVPQRRPAAPRATTLDRTPSPPPRKPSPKHPQRTPPPQVCEEAKQVV